MRIENEMMSRFKQQDFIGGESDENYISVELDMFFDNVMNTVVDYFQEEQQVFK